MIHFFVKKDCIYRVTLDENMNMQQAMQYLFQETFYFAYLSNHKYVECLNQTFKQAGIQNGEIIEIL